MASDGLTQPGASRRLSLVYLLGTINQYTRSFGGIEETSLDRGCKWTGL
jgi:hypothetical protein